MFAKHLHGLLAERNCSKTLQTAPIWNRDRPIDFPAIHDFTVPPNHIALPVYGCNLLA